MQVQNHSGREIVALRGGLTAEAGAGAPLDVCQVAIDQREPLDPYGSREIRCAVTQRRFTDAERAYVEASPGRFTELWRPRYLKFANGETIDAGS